MFLSTSKGNSLILIKLTTKFKNLKTANKKECIVLKFLRQYNIIEVNGNTKLIYPVRDQEGIRYYVFNEEKLFGIHNEMHIFTGFRGRDLLIGQLEGKFQNVTIKVCLTIGQLVEPCVQKLKHDKKGLVVKPLLSKEVNSQCQVTLTVCQSHPDQDFKFIMVYQRKSVKGCCDKTTVINDCRRS